MKSNKVTPREIFEFMKRRISFGAVGRISGRSSRGFRSTYKETSEIKICFKEIIESSLQEIDEGSSARIN